MNSAIAFTTRSANRMSKSKLFMMQKRVGAPGDQAKFDKPDGHLHLTGIHTSGNIVPIFKVDKSRPKKPRATVEPASVARNLTIDIPNQGWSIGILNCGFGRLAKESNGAQFICRGTAGNGLNLSIFVESPHGSGMGTEDVYKYYWPRASRNPLLDARSVKMQKEDRFVKVTYTTLDMPNVNFY